MDIKEIKCKVDVTCISFYRESNTSFAMNYSGESVIDDKPYTTQNIADLIKNRLEIMMANPDSRSLSVLVAFEQCLETPQTCTQDDIQA